MNELIAKYKAQKPMPVDHEFWETFINDTVVLATIAFVAVVFISQSPKLMHKANNLIIFLLYKTGLRTLNVPDRWKVAWHDIEIIKKIGEGGFSTVYKAKLKKRKFVRETVVVEEKIVALKLIDQKYFDQETLESFCTEIAIMSNLSHENIVRLEGVCVEPSHLGIIMEYFSNGSLADILTEKAGDLDWKTRLQFAIDVAKGVNYLHSQKPKIIHRDIKASNVLVDDNMVAKITDFGLSKLKEKSFQKDKEPEFMKRSYVFSSGCCGTPGYQAPEVMNEEPYNEAADAYSFGVLLWELLENREPKLSVDYTVVNRPNIWAQESGEEFSESSDEYSETDTDCDDDTNTDTNNDSLQVTENTSSFKKHDFKKKAGTHPYYVCETEKQNDIDFHSESGEQSVTNLDNKNKSAKRNSNYEQTEENNRQEKEKRNSNKRNSNDKQTTEENERHDKGKQKPNKRKSKDKQTTEENERSCENESGRQSLDDEISSGSESSHSDDDSSDYEDETWKQPGGRPRLPPWCPQEFKELIELCWEIDPTKRPNFKTILQKLEKIPKDFVLPPIEKNTEKENQDAQKT
eukprot:CAMPEP_0174258662 /NCGR_PEP_ID=MMETSP0439-20130205/7618_1 /TAXON_ID=0 /ORGANISM="Stereomyxa ramosa, Strain Chinc5" /LENGTH=574 /DNA_ID=CAMNT_0015342253 /DNA_START=51 /DNA_END=1772 /DNA_ORIENTATION=+